MQLQDFHYDLPPELIAQFPLPERSASRLLHIFADAIEPSHRQFKDLPQLLRPGDLLVFNNTAVIPARLYATKQTGGKVEIMLERILSENQALALLRSSKASKPGTQLQLANDQWVEVIERRNEFYVIKFLGPKSILETIESIGHIPLPPYINRSDSEFDWDRYQTVYAKEKGAVAAPTAGLHFDNDLLIQLQNRGIEFAYLTLHVGAGTFQPVRVADITQHRMHTEFINVPEQLCQQIASVKAKGGRVIAVGTTSMRSLETAARSGELRPYQGDTDIFIYPGFEFHCVDALITNFHLPESTLMMLVCAFGGYERMMHAYRTAVSEKYRFFSYGDAMFIEPN